MFPIYLETREYLTEYEISIVEPILSKDITFGTAKELNEYPLHYYLVKEADLLLQIIRFIHSFTNLYCRDHEEGAITHKGRKDPLFYIEIRHCFNSIRSLSSNNDLDTSFKNLDVDTKNNLILLQNQVAFLVDKTRREL